MTLSARCWGGRVMGTHARLKVVTGNPAAGDAALRHAVEDLNITEKTLSRFMEDSALSRLNRLGTAAGDARLLAAVEKSIDAYEWSGGLLDPRTGAPSAGDLAYATVAAPTILEADLAAKLLILEGPSALERFDDGYRAITTDRNGRTEVFA